VPQTVRAQWRSLVGGYIASRETLAGVVVLMDARHPLSALDRQLIEFLGAQRLLALLSKADKLSRVEQARTLEAVRAALPASEVRLFSSLSGEGVEECRALLAGWLEPAAGRGNKKPPVKGM